jgi:hypothetical protein
MNFASVVRTSTVTRTAETRVAQYDWSMLSDELSSYGCAVIGKLLSPEECRQIAGLYPEEGHFRSHIHMARHGFGKGEYRYFRYPLPDPIGGLRTALYPHLATIANGWNERMGIDQRYPERHLAFPLQVAILLSEPESDFTGGEFVLTEQRPRMQSRAEVVPLRQGDAAQSGHCRALERLPIRNECNNWCSASEIKSFLRPMRISEFEEWLRG